MDTTVTQLGVVVTAALRAAGYKESTIGQYLKTIRLLEDFIDARGGIYTSALGAEFAALTTSPRTGRFSAQRRFAYSRAVNVCDSYLRTGEVDLSPRQRGGGGRQPEADAFTMLNAMWEADMSGRGLAPATREAYGRITRSYLGYLEDCGISCLDDATPATVPGFFASLLDHGWAPSSLFWQVANFRPFVKFTGRGDLVDAIGLVGARRSHTIIPVLSDDDAQRLVTACASADTVSRRDAAITLLALMTGLRACDIINLRLTDIDWRAQTISLVQQKTSNPVTLPLPGLLVNPLADYLLTQRPDSNDDHVFLRSLAPHTQLADHASVYRITAETFRKAGITDVKAGTRFLRHNAASRLLRASVPLPTIAAVLGHASQESTNVYMSVDQQRLLDCVLPVPAGARP
ncbi:site-specific integrase [Corynebacterium halotolerans]|uniref:Integrase/recombinase n=1 Tax=Corynebacterium halotolerans YIM 70093 = DSM 44683 TaxID=1121362 RepID=M1P8Q8_9CORY|nr:site-specific integrase [Corynebacterium halotolerans]AGF71132.1 integrase/recombinase [Corynebacterium halotolerans YIM 70093 = DSM 44683]AGF73046.1 integrase/recombinase [Corynebacterium halotolerans YIM 70093 = DSM 44683]